MSGHPFDKVMGAGGWPSALTAIPSSESASGMQLLVR